MLDADGAEPRNHLLEVGGWSASTVSWGGVRRHHTNEVSAPPGRRTGFRGAGRAVGDLVLHGGARVDPRDCAPSIALDRRQLARSARSADRVRELQGQGRFRIRGRSRRSVSVRRREGDSNPRRLAPRGFSSATQGVHGVCASPLTSMYSDTSPVDSTSYDRIRPTLWLEIWLARLRLGGAMRPRYSSSPGRPSPVTGTTVRRVGA